MSAACGIRISNRCRRDAAHPAEFEANRAVLRLPVAILQGEHENFITVAREVREVAASLWYNQRCCLIS
jgi:hypothetical protein